MAFVSIILIFGQSKRGFVIMDQHKDQHNSDKIWRPVHQDAEQGLVIQSPSFKKIKGSFVFWVKEFENNYDIILDPNERGGLRCLVFGRRIPWHWIYFKILRWADSGRTLFVAPVSGDWERVIQSVERKPEIPDRWVYPVNPFYRAAIMEETQLDRIKKMVLGHIADLRIDEMATDQMIDDWVQLHDFLEANVEDAAFA